jgi:hypothetical protein
VVQQSSPPPAFLNAYSQVLNQATGVATAPLQQYSGQQVADLTPAQTQAIQEVQNTQGIAQPYINAAAQQYGAATTPLTTQAPQIAPGVTLFALHAADGTPPSGRFTRETVRAIRANVFYRPFAPGDERGTVRHGERLYRGAHLAACAWDEWQTMQQLARGRRLGWRRAPEVATVDGAIQFVSDTDQDIDFVDDDGDAIIWTSDSDAAIQVVTKGRFRVQRTVLG